MNAEFGTATIGFEPQARDVFDFLVGVFFRPEGADEPGVALGTRRIRFAIAPGADPTHAVDLAAPLAASVIRVHLRASAGN